MPTSTEPYGGEGPSFGHRVLASLIAARLVPCVFTTNFDPLIERAVAVADELLPIEQRAHLTVAALDSNERAERCLRESAWPLLAKVHGDYQSEQLKNTAAELVAQDERHRHVLIEACQRFGLVVVGYSGRDASIMDALGAALGRHTPFPAGLFWITRPRTPLLPATVARGGSGAQQVGPVRRGARIERGWRAALADRPAGRFRRRTRRSSPPRPRQLRLQEASTTPAVRDFVRDLRPRPPRAAVLGPARPHHPLDGSKFACVGDRVAAFGRDSDLLAGLAPLGAQLDGDVRLDPRGDSWALGLLYDALTRALVRGRPLRPMLRTAGHSLVLTQPDTSRGDDAADRDRQSLRPLLSAYDGPIGGTVPGGGARFAEAVGVRLEWWLERWWCVFDPYTWVETRPRENGQPAAGGTVDAAADFRRERWAKRYNRTWAQIIGAWAGLLAPNDPTTVRAVGVHDDPGMEATFSIGTVTAWSRPQRGGGWPPA